MNKSKRTILAAAAVAASLTFALAGCGLKKVESSSEATVAFGTASDDAVVKPVTDYSGSEESSETAESSGAADSSGSTDSTDSTDNSKTTEAASAAATQGSELFTERDLQQTADLTDAVSISLEDGKTITIDTAGVYVLSGTAKNAQIIVDTGDEDKVQLVLDGVSVTNESIPCIYVKNADKVFVTTTDSENSLTVSAAFLADGDTNTDAAVFSKEDLVLNGVGTLSISSSDNAVSSKDDLKITGGTYVINCGGNAFEAHEQIAVADGTLTVESCNDGLHAENDEDDTVGEVFVEGGTISVNAADDGIHATTTVTIDGGTFDLKAAEGIEATVVTINDGQIRIEASDDGINAAQKSTALSPLAEFNGGSVTIEMGQGDTDAVDSNGDLTINGGTLTISAQSPFDYDGTASKNGGTIIVNGEEVDEITNQFGGGMGGGPGGNADGGFGGEMGGGPGGGKQGGFGGPGR